MSDKQPLDATLTALEPLVSDGRPYRNQAPPALTRALAEPAAPEGWGGTLVRREPTEDDKAVWLAMRAHARTSRRDEA